MMYSNIRGTRSGKSFEMAISMGAMLNLGKTVSLCTPGNADQLIIMLNQIGVKAKATLQEDGDMIAIGSPARREEDAKTYKIELA